MIDYSCWEKYDGAYNGSGRSEKIWLQNPGNICLTGLFKYKKDADTTDYVSEYLAYKIASALGIKCAEFQIAQYNGKIGSFSFNFLDKYENLLEGIYFIQKSYPTYDMDKMCDEFGQYYSLDIIRKSLTYYSEQYYNDFLCVPVFDFLIGNTDRHQNNWGFVQKEGVLSLAPLYDNSSSLCAYMSNLSYIDLSRDKRRWNALIDSKSLSSIRIGKSDKKRSRHSDVIRYLLKSDYYERVNYLCDNIVDIIDEKLIDDILSDDELKIVDCKRLEIIKYYLLGKVDLLKSVMEEK